MLLELPLKTKVLDRSLLALSAASLGRAYGDQTLIHESASLYVRSLSELQRALWNPRLACDDEILAACLTLSMYELMECPSEGAHAYASHCEGILALIQHRGPHAHRSGLARQLFLTTRMQGVCSFSSHNPAS